MRDLERQHDAGKEEREPDDKEGVRAEMCHLIDDAPHAQTARNLPDRLPIE